MEETTDPEATEEEDSEVESVEKVDDDDDEEDASEVESEEEILGVEVDVVDDDDHDDDEDYPDDDDDDDDDDYPDPALPATKSRSDSQCLFTNGLGCSANDKSRLTPVVESAASKNMFSAEFVPGPALSNLITRWARKPACNFIADIFNSCYVVAREIGLDSAFQLCNLRGWIVTLPKIRSASTSPFNLGYKRFHECLKNAGFPDDHRGLHLLGVIQSAYNNLETSDLPPIGDSAVVVPTKKRRSSKSTTTPAEKSKSAVASPQHELMDPHDPVSFQTRLTQNAKCLQIALFLMGFIFASTTVPIDTAKSKTKLFFSMFSTCYSSRRFVELCHRLLVHFDTPVPDADKVRQLTEDVFGEDSTIDLHDYISGKVFIGQVQTAALHDKLEKDVIAKFRRSSTKNYNNRNPGDQLAILRHVVLAMFVRYEGNQVDASKKTPMPNPAARRALTDPMVVAPNKTPGSLLSTPSPTPPPLKRNVVSW